MAISPEQLRTDTNISNLIFWMLYGGLNVNTKWCKLLGNVDINFDCDGCTQCEGKE